MANPKTSYLSLVAACDNFPYDGPGQCYQLFLPDDPRPHGYMIKDTVTKMPWTDDFTIDHTNRTVTLHLPTSPSPPNYSTFATTAFATVITSAITSTLYPKMSSHSELFVIPGARTPVHFERFAARLFGLTGRGAHCTVYTYAPDLRIWVPRRSPSLFTYPNKLDTTVAGGVPAHQTPFQNLVQEADEEASLPEALIRERARAAGVLTYMNRGARDGLVAADSVYVYDLEVGPEVVPVPKDGEVKEFSLMTVEEVRGALFAGEFKTNSAVVMIDFFVRHGILKPEDDEHYVEIVSRMHRRLPFPTSATQ